MKNWNSTARARAVGLAALLASTTALAACGAGKAQNPADDGAAGEQGGGTQAASSACPVGEPDEGIDTTVRIDYQNIPNGALLVKQEGLLEACMPNADISWFNFESGGAAIQGFGSDSVDIGLAGSSPSVKAMSAPLNIDVQTVYIFDVIGDAESLVVKDPSITDLAGLKGKKVAVPFSSTAHFSLLKVLQDEGLTGEVELVNLSPEAIVAAFDRGEVDAAWTWAPTLTQLLDDGATRIMSNADAARLGFATFDLAIAKREFIEANPDFMVMWTKIQDYASTQISEHPEEAAVPVAAELGLQPEDVLKQFPGYEYPDAETQLADYYGGDEMASILEETAQFLAEQGEIDKVAAHQVYVDGVYPTALEEVGQ